MRMAVIGQETIGMAKKAAKVVTWDDLLNKVQPERIKGTSKQNKAAYKWRALAKQITPAQWKARLSKVTDRVTRIQCACIIWWDFFSSCQSDKTPKTIDDFKNAWRPTMDIDADLVGKTLTEVFGYPLDYAKQRSKILNIDLVVKERLYAEDRQKPDERRADDASDNTEE